MHQKMGALHKDASEDGGGSGLHKDASENGWGGGMGVVYTSPSASSCPAGGCVHEAEAAEISVLQFVAASMAL